MGWTTCYTVKHYKWVKGRQVVDRKACCDDLYTWDNKDANGNVLGTNRVLKSSMVGSVWYGAVETVTLATGERKVWAGVCLTCGRSSDGTIFGYKDMDETGGPYYCKCPVGILSLLTPTTNERAIGWRQDCRDYAKRKSVTQKLDLPPGITCTYRGGWVISSPEYRSHYAYSGVRYHRSNNKLSAVTCFIEKYGTPEQRSTWPSSRPAA